MMGRSRNAVALGLALAAAVGLYMIKYDTRLIDDRVHRLERQIEAAESDIGLLQAEHATLTRPDRIEKLARLHLGLAPLAPGQIGAVGDIPWREEVASSAPSVAP